MHEWHNVHTADCQVTHERADLLAAIENYEDMGAAHLRLADLKGAVPEYDDGGDQEVENCTCGVLASFDVEVCVDAYGAFVGEFCRIAKAALNSESIGLGAEENTIKELLRTLKAADPLINLGELEEVL